MKPPLSLPSIGPILCLFFPLSNLVNLLLSFPAGTTWGAFVLSFILVPSVILGVFLTAIWFAWRDHFTWNTASEAEHEEFLLREQTPTRTRWLATIALMLLISNLTAFLLYALHWLWKPPAISLLAFLAATFASYGFSALAALLWLTLCDRKLRATRPVTP